MRQTDKSLQNENFEQVVGGLGKPLGKSPAPDRIQFPRDLDRSFPCWPGSVYFGTAPGGVLSTAEGPRPFQLGTPDGHNKTSGRRRNERSHRFAPRRPLGPPSLKPIWLTSVTTVTSRGTSPHSVPSLIALANVGNRLSAFMPLPTVTSKKTRSSIRPTPWTTRKTSRPDARVGIARRNAKVYGDKTLTSCPSALRDRRHVRPMPTRNAKLPPCLRHGRRGEHSANKCSPFELDGFRRRADHAFAHPRCKQQSSCDEVCNTSVCRHRRCASI